MPGARHELIHQVLDEKRFPPKTEIRGEWETEGTADVHAHHHVPAVIDVKRVEHQGGIRSGMLDTERFPASEVIDQCCAGLPGDFPHDVRILVKLDTPLAPVRAPVGVRGVVRLENHLSAERVETPMDLEEVAFEFFGRDVGADFAVVSADRDEGGVRLKSCGIHIEPRKKPAAGIPADAGIEAAVNRAEVLRNREVDTIEPVHPRNTPLRVGRAESEKVRAPPRLQMFDEWKKQGKRRDMGHVCILYTIIGRASAECGVIVEKWRVRVSWAVQSEHGRRLLTTRC